MAIRLHRQQNTGHQADPPAFPLDRRLRRILPDARDRQARADNKERGSWFSHKAEDARPYYYKVYLADYDVTAEVAPTERAAMMQFTYPATDDAFTGNRRLRRQRLGQGRA